jgi:WD40 repeat protein
MIYSMAMKNEAKKLARYTLNAFAYAAVILVLLLGTVAIYYYANGYRFDFTKGSIEKTGVLSVETIPSRATLLVNGQEVGRTPKTVTSVEEGIAQVEVTKDRYVTWNKSVPIKAEKSSPIFPYLVIEDPIREVVHTSDETFVRSYMNKENDYFFFITESGGDYTIWRYDITRNFWDLTQNPNDVYTVSSPNVTDVDLNISPDGRAAVLITTITDPVTKGSTKEFSLLHTVRNGVVIEDLDLEDFSGSYTFTWSNDSKYIVMDSDTEILTLKISDRTKYLILRKAKDKKYVWTTDTSGFMYLVTNVAAEELSSNSQYTLSQMLLDGTNKTTLIERIYSQGTDEYLKTIRESMLDFVPFTNAPENTRFAGEIASIAVDQETGGLFIQTTLASYWYTSELEKYILINPYTSRFISFSPDKTKLLYEDRKNKNVGVFTFDKEESDHVTQIGSKNIIPEGFTSTGEIEWLYNSQAVIYRTDEQVKLVDTDGENDTKLIENTLHPTMVDESDKYLHTIEVTENEKLLITKYQIN